MTLTLTGVSKTFPGQQALHAVDFRLDLGEVQALVGQNGSGKSTLIKLLSGYHRPDAGCVAVLDGERFDLGSVRAARDAGLRFVHQDLGLVLNLSVVENVLLGRDYPRGLGGRIRWREAAEQARACLRQVGLEADPYVPVGSLSLAQRTLVAIARALPERGGRPVQVVLDEPTAALPSDEVGVLLSAIGRLRADGHGVLLVSHRLNEVLEVADRVTVLRDGRVSASVGCSELDYDGLTELIVGHPVAASQSVPRMAERESEDGQVVLRVHELSGSRLVDVSFEVRAGEILGVAGITGSGREALAPLLTGQLPRAGRVHVCGQVLPPESPRKTLALGLASIPGERSRYGLFRNLGVRANMTLSDLRRHRRFGRIRLRRERDEVEDWVSRLGIVTPGPEAPIGSLSGGNQQKVLVGRALRLRPRVLVLDDPTQGIDIGARTEIHRILEDCARDGMAILLISTDSDELAQLSDRIIVLARGRIADRVDRSPELTADVIDVSQLVLARYPPTERAATQGVGR